MAEFVGTCALLIGVVGSGVMGENLAGGNVAVALLANSIATGAILYVIITAFIDVSGAHFNPAVSLYALLTRSIDRPTFFYFVVAQVLGAVLGVWIVHIMFKLDMFQFSTKVRSGSALVFSEFVATAGLLGTIHALRAKTALIPAAVALYITGAYWFTSSTSFANPAVTLARAFTDTFAGIHPSGVPAFIGAQFLCAAVLVFCLRKFVRD